MKQWFEIDPATRRVKGWCRSGSATVLPGNTATSEFIECDDVAIAQNDALQAQSAADGRDSTVLCDAQGVLSLPVDARSRFTITADKNTATANGIDTVTFTVTALRADGTVRTAFNQTLVYETNNRLIGLNFVNGVATKTVNMPQSGRFKFGSNKDAKFDAAVTITAIE